MTEAFSANLGSHLGRHLLYWAISQSDFWYLANRCAEFVNKFHSPLERGVQVLDHLLTLEEEEFGWGNHYAHVYENQQVIQPIDNEGPENRKEVFPSPAEQDLTEKSRPFKEIHSWTQVTKIHLIRV